MRRKNKIEIIEKKIPIMKMFREIHASAHT